VHSNLAKAQFSTQQIEKNRDIEKLTKLTKVHENAASMVGQFIVLLRKQKPNVPASYWANLQKRISTKPFVGKVASIYDAFYSHEEIKKMIVHYQNPAGQRKTELLTRVNEQLYQAGNAFGKEIGKYLQEQLKKDGY
jgi:hypothetical protein